MQVLVPKDDSLLGKMFEVVITSTGKHYLKGQVLTESLTRAPPRPAPLPHGAVSGTKKWQEKRNEIETIAAATTKTLSPNGHMTSKPHQTDSISWTFNWLRGTDLLLILLAALVLCTAVVSHYTQLFAFVW